MIGTLLGVIVGLEGEIALGGDKAEGGDDALVGPTKGLIAEGESAQIDGPGRRVVKLNEIL